MKIKNGSSRQPGDTLLLYLHAEEQHREESPFVFHHCTSIRRENVCVHTAKSTTHAMLWSSLSEHRALCSELSWDGEVPCPFQNTSDLLPLHSEFMFLCIQKVYHCRVLPGSHTQLS